MRALFTCVRYLAHFHTLVPIARAVADAGHEVAFAAAELQTPLIAPGACFSASPGRAPVSPGLTGRAWRSPGTSQGSDE